MTLCKIVNQLTLLADLYAISSLPETRVVVWASETLPIVPMSRLNDWLATRRIVLVNNLWALPHTPNRNQPYNTECDNVIKLLKIKKSNVLPFYKNLKKIITILIRKFKIHFSIQFSIHFGILIAV